MGDSDKEEMLASARQQSWFVSVQSFATTLSHIAVLLALNTVSLSFMSTVLAGVEEPPAPTPAVSDFLRRFDEIAARGFVATQRRGATGVGHTMEPPPGLTEEIILKLISRALKSKRGQQLRSEITDEPVPQRTLMTGSRYSSRTH